jgi:hypothetical protein
MVLEALRRCDLLFGVVERALDNGRFRRTRLSNDFYFRADHRRISRNHRQRDVFLQAR